MTDVKQKLVYEAPEVEKFGTFEAITEGGIVGGKLDAAFPTNTPKPDLTFS